MRTASSREREGRLPLKLRQSCDIPADASSLGPPEEATLGATVADRERTSRSIPASIIRALALSLEASGIAFIPENGGDARGLEAEVQIDGGSL